MALSDPRVGPNFAERSTGCMDRTMESACVHMCDPDPAVARDACNALLALTSKSLRSDPSRFDHILAPVLARLSERPLGAFGLLEDTLKLLLVLLESGEPDLLAADRLERVFPLVCERLLALLDELLGEMPGTSARMVAQLEDILLQVLQASRVLICRWYVSRGDSELPRIQLGYLAHLAVQLLSVGVFSKGRPTRDQVISSVLVLQSMADTEATSDLLLNFYPGVCTALVKLLLQAGKEFKVGFKIVIVGCSCLGAWLRVVLGNARNSELLAAESRPPLTLAEIFRQHNDPDGERGPETATACKEGQVPHDAYRNGTHGPRTGHRIPPKLSRDSAWLEETSRQSSEALIAVLHQAEVATETLWAEKAAVRLAFIGLCVTILKHCDRTVTGRAVEACFEVVLAGLSDDSEEARQAATGFMRDLLVDKSAGEAVKVRGRIVEWLVRLTGDLGSVSSKMEGARHVPKRLARLDGLLAFVEGAGEQMSWQAVPATRACEVLEPVLQALSLETSGLQNLLRDERPLTSVPGSSISHAERLVTLFPYDLQDMAQAEESAGLEAGELHGLLTDGHEVQTWLLRALKLAGGDVGLARQVKTVLGRLGRVTGIESAMTSVFEDAQCSWHLELQTLEEPFPLFPSHASTTSGFLGSASKQRRVAAMFALMAFLDACTPGACGIGKAGTPSPIPSWLALQSLCLGLAGRSPGDTCPGSRCLDQHIMSLEPSESFFCTVGFRVATQGCKYSARMP